MPFLNALKKNLGFTLIETLVIIMIVGVLSAIAIPSFISFVDRTHLNNAVAEVRTALQIGQREAILRSQVCTVGLSTTERTVTSYCLNDERNLHDQVTFATNISKNFSLPGNPINIDFGVLGTADFILVKPSQASANNQLLRIKKYLEMSWQQSPNQPIDPSGKIVLYISKNPSLTKKCIVISNILGLTRTGNYKGKIISDQITQSGICGAS